MPENQQEQSEAKLLAYIEGELDAAERAEIEKHLEANPHHRMMLQELSRTRDMVRWLPREQAPGDLLEAFQSQLERSALLEDRIAVAEYAGAGKISGWSQWRAIAAAVVLAAGLGVIVWVALPGGKQFVQAPVANPGTASADSNESGAIAAKPSAESPPAAPEVDVRNRKGELLPEPSREKIAAATPPPVAMAKASQGIPPNSDNNLRAPGLLNSQFGAATPESQVGMVLAQTARTAEQLQVIRDNIASGNLGNSRGGGLRMASMKAAPAPQVADNANNPIYVVVAATDPDVVSGQITQYLASNSIRWDNLDALSQNGASRFGANGSVMAVNNGGPSILAQAAPQVSQAPAAAAPAGNSTPAAPSAVLPVPAPPSIAPSPAPVQAAPIPQAVAVVPPPAPMPAADAAGPQVPQPNPSQQKDGVADQQVATGNAASINNLIIARRMTRGQAMELRGNFNRPTDSQYAEVFEPTPVESSDKQIVSGQQSQELAKASTEDQSRPASPAAKAVARSSQIAGIDADNSAFTPGSPTTAPSTQPIGQAAIQRVEPMPDAAARIPSTRPWAPLARNAARIATSRPTALPQQRAMSTTSPSSPDVNQTAAAAPDGLASASTQQSASTQPSDEPVDVVIVVQKSDIADATPPAATVAPNIAATEPASPSQTPVPVPAPSAQQAK